MRVLACLHAAGMQVFAAPVQLGAESRPAEIEHVQCDLQSRPSWPRMFSFGTRMSWNAIRAVAVPRMPTFSMRASSTWKPGMSGVTRNAVTFVRRSRYGRAGHDRQHVGNAFVGDVALAVEDVGCAVRRRGRCGLTLPASEPAFFFGERERPSFSPRHNPGSQ